MWNIKDSIQAVLPQVVAWRRHFHQHPELGLEEKATTEHVARVLEDLGVEVRRFQHVTGVLGTLQGGLPGPTIALRADMDALPVEELAECDFRSLQPGLMHACGHDLHIANLLGVASVLAAHRDQVPGAVKFVFQPAEEGKGGARYLIDEGVMEGVDQVYALHVNPEIPTGQISITPGACTANSDTATITITGKGGHGAHPEQTIDAVVVGAQIVGALQTIVSRNLAAQEAGVVTIGTFHAGTVRNIIAERAEMTLSLRSLTADVQSKLRQRIEAVVEGIALAHGATCEFEYRYGYPSVQNHEAAVKAVVQAASAVLGEENVVVNPRASMVGEDFAYYGQHAPAALFWLGAAPEDVSRWRPLHNPAVLFNEDCLPLGMEIMIRLVLQAGEQA
ncbi:MAG: M20 metallopeptidase family protein [Bacillota bacterium]